MLFLLKLEIVWDFFKRKYLSFIEHNHLEGGNRNGLLLLSHHTNVSNNTVTGFRQYGLKFSGDDTVINDNTFYNGGHFSAYKHIKDEQQTGIICSDDWTQHNVRIQRNTIKNWSHMPALLLKSVVDAQVTDNLFEMDLKHWTQRDYIGGTVDEHRVIKVTSSSFMNRTQKSKSVALKGNQLWSPKGKVEISQ